MFSIKTRILDDFNMLKNVDLEYFDIAISFIYGCVTITLGEYELGSTYYEKPCFPDHQGDVQINVWFEFLLDALVHLEKGGYYAFEEPEKHRRWIELKLEGEKVRINAVEIMGRNVSRWLSRTTPLEAEQYDKIFTYEMSYSDFKESVLLALDDFIDQLSELNPVLRRSGLVASLTEMQSDLREVDKGIYSFVNEKYFNLFRNTRGANLIENMSRTCNIEQVLSTAALLFPGVTEIDDCYFITSFYNCVLESKLDQLSGDRVRVQRFVNVCSLIEMFSSYQRNQRGLLERFSKVLKKSWELYFPYISNEKEEFVVQIGIELDTTLTVYQKWNVF